MGARIKERKKTRRKANSLVGQGELLDRPKVLREGALAEQVVRDANHGGSDGRALRFSRGTTVLTRCPATSESYDGFSPPALCCVRGATVAKDAAGLARLLAFWVNLKPSNSSSQNSGETKPRGKFRLFRNGPLESLAKGRRLRRRREGGRPGAQRDPDLTDPLSRDRVRED